MSKSERIELGNGMILDIHECPQDDVGIMLSSEEVLAGPIAVGELIEDTCKCTIAQDCSWFNPTYHYDFPTADQSLKESLKEWENKLGIKHQEMPWEKEKKEEVKSIAIKHVIFDGPATIVFWDDGTKTVVKCTDGDDYSYEVGIAMATLKKIFGESYGTYRHAVRDAISDAIDHELKKKDRKKTLATRDILGLEKIVEGLKKAYGIKDKP